MEVDLGGIIDGIETAKAREDEFSKQFEDTSEEAQKASKAIDGLKNNTPPVSDTPRETKTETPPLPDTVTPEVVPGQNALAKILNTLKNNAATFIIGVLLIGGGWFANSRKTKKSRDEAEAGADDGEEND